MADDKRTRCTSTGPTGYIAAVETQASAAEPAGCRVGGGPSGSAAGIGRWCELASDLLGSRPGTLRTCMTGRVRSTSRPPCATCEGRRNALPRRNASSGRPLSQARNRSFEALCLLIGRTALGGRAAQRQRPSCDWLAPATCCEARRSPAVNLHLPLSDAAWMSVPAPRPHAVPVSCSSRRSGSGRSG